MPRYLILDLLGKFLILSSARPLMGAEQECIQRDRCWKQLVRSSGWNLTLGALS
jgi:hypothetical protein